MSTNAMSTARSCVRVFREREVMYHAAALSYYTIVSVVPLLTLLLFLTTVLHQKAVTTAVTEFTGAYLLPAGEEEVLAALQEISADSHFTLISLVLTLWGALKLFTGLERSFTVIFSSEPAGWRRQVRMAFVTLLAVGLATVASGGLIGAIGILSHSESHYGPVVLVVVLTIAFFPIYYLLPDLDLSPRDVLPGTVFAAVGWTLLSTAFAVYVAAIGSVGGVIGSFLLLLTWFYFAGLVILLGGVLNAVLLDSGSADDVSR